MADPPSYRSMPLRLGLATCRKLETRNRHVNFPKVGALTMHPEAEYGLLLDEPIKHEFPMGFVTLNQIIELRVEKEVDLFDHPDKLTTTISVTFINNSGQAFVVEAQCTCNPKIYEGNHKGRVTPTR